ncbi:TonB-dependent receptor domain-containing protein [Neisseria bacilliformis]|uniref:TonB-dependent receptor n=2 Tax=Neisseria bacilliformis TaxID=267212 RepID=UPI0036F42643
MKMLQNGSDVVDMSAISPDHVVAADTLLAKQVEIVRGTPTLLYSSASPAGVVNITDSRIPEKVPEKGYEGEVFVRADSASKERAATAGLTLGLGSRVALRLEGLSRKSDLYKVPGVKLEETVYRLPDSNNKSHVGTLGLSYAGEKGYLGAAYSCRNDDYGVVGHNHMYDPCSAHIFNPENRTTFENRDYLLMYPHLMDGSDLIRELHFHCGTPHEENKPHSHDNIYGHHHDHSSPGPQIALFSRRFDVRGEWRQPFAGLDKLKISAAHADYLHDELHDGKFYTDPLYPEAEQKRRADTAAARKGKPETVFANKGFNARIEAYHSPIGSLKGLIGAQYQTQKSSAVRLMEDRDVEKNRFALVPNTDKRASIFALEQLKLGSLTLEAGARWERQRIPVHYDRAALDEFIRRHTTPFRRSAKPNLADRRESAFSYSGTLLWDFTPANRLSLTASHNERLPAPMELYYHGKHLAIQSFEHGNKELKKERSDNFEIGLAHDSGRLHYKISVYHNRFANYIHNENLHRSGNLFIRRYNQTPARFTGAEGEIGWRITPKHDITLFGDFVKGRLKNLPAITGEKIYSREEDCEDEDGEPTYCVLGTDTISPPNRNAARAPPPRPTRIQTHQRNRPPLARPPRIHPRLRPTPHLAGYVHQNLRKSGSGRRRHQRRRKSTLRPPLRRTRARRFHTRLPPRQRRHQLPRQMGARGRIHRIAARQQPAQPKNLHPQLLPALRTADGTQLRVWRECEVLGGGNKSSPKTDAGCVPQARTRLAESGSLRNQQSCEAKTAAE